MEYSFILTVVGICCFVLEDCLKKPKPGDYEGVKFRRIAKPILEKREKVISFTRPVGYGCLLFAAVLQFS